MELYLFNTMTKQKELFVPYEQGKVGMYVCGVTPYDFSHIGHARAYVAFDVLHRYLKYLGYEVKYVRNFTDIDDKIIKRANEAGEDFAQLSRRFSDAFLEDMEKLQCLPPTHEPRVTEHIKDIVEMIGDIVDHGHAYVVNGDVYFDVDSFPQYCCLSGQNKDDHRASAGGRVIIDSGKRNHADFALWKSAKEGEPSWDSNTWGRTWGHGRPGWHIECSAMSAFYLGRKFDIHGGGKDLVFPHHENELAQSQAAQPESHVKYWMHNGFVNKDNQKMSKSDNNFFTIRDILANYDPVALRFFLMRTHYRADVNYSNTALDNASDRVFYMYQTMHDCKVALSSFPEIDADVPVPKKDMEVADKFRSSFRAAMSDDLHTTAVLDDLMEPLKSINSNLNDLKKFKVKKQQQLSAQKQKQQQQQLHSLLQGLSALQKVVQDVLDIIGLSPPSSFDQALQQLKGMALRRAGMTEEELQQKIEERTAARKNKQYAESDAIRKRLAAIGIALMDEPEGTMWRPCEPEISDSRHTTSQPVSQPVSTEQSA